MSDRQITRHEDGSVSWPCRRCSATVHRYRGQSDVDCPSCGACYNASGQRLRDDWRGNMSNYDQDVSDLDGYEVQQLRAERVVQSAHDKEILPPAQTFASSQDYYDYMKERGL